MIRSKKIESDVLEFKHSEILFPVLGGIVFMLIGGFVLNQGLQGPYTEETEYMFAAGMGALFSIIGACLLLFVTKVNIFHFNKQTGNIEYERKRLLPNIRETFPMDKVKKILIAKQIRRNRNRSSSGRRRSSTRIIYKYLLEFDNGSKIMMGKKSKSAASAILSMGASSTPKAVTEVSEFLGVPIEEPGLQEAIGQTVNSIKDVMSGNQTMDEAFAQKEPPKNE